MMNFYILEKNYEKYRKKSDRIDFQNILIYVKITGRSSNPIKYHKKIEGMKFKKL